MFLAQTAEANDALKAAAEAIKGAAQHSWEAGLVAVTMAFCFVALALLARAWMQQTWMREDRMAKRIDALETFIRETLANIISADQKAIDRVAAAVESLREALEQNPCLWTEERQREMLERLKIKP